MDAWDLVVRRDELSDVQLLEISSPTIGAGEVRLKVDRVGLTANNVTYALAGESMRYWDFFPTEAGWGRVPLWGFAEVDASNVAEVPVGTRFYGYLPSSSHLVVRPERIDVNGFKDASVHRAALPGAYNVYSTTTGDPTYTQADEDLQILYRPLFMTSFMLEDFLADEAWFGAEAILFSSASSKTAYGTAFCAQQRTERPALIGLTSKRNVDFTASLGCYDEVIPYDDVPSITPSRKVAYVDMAGSVEVRRAVHEHFGDALVHDAVVGATHLEALPTTPHDVPGVHPRFFFAPDRITKRRADWGPKGIEQSHAETWAKFVPTVRGWVEVAWSDGPDALRAAWLEVLSGTSDPRTGHVIEF